MLYTDGKQIDLSKYKRFFVFGCSFTNYRWDTWADLLSKQMPDAEYHNFARSGAGQLFIQAQLSQAINKYNIGSDDLVAVMWSTFYREDRYKYDSFWDNWLTPGNLFTQGDYDHKFIYNFCCRRGMLVRDLAIIDTTMRLFKNAPWDSFAMLGVPVDMQDYYAGINDDADFLAAPLTDVVELYSSLNSMLMKDLMSDQAPEGWNNTYKYFDDDMQAVYEDYHPSVVGYAEYLSNLGFMLSEDLIAYVGQEHERLLKVTNKRELNENAVEMIL